MTKNWYVLIGLIVLACALTAHGQSNKKIKAVLDYARFRQDTSLTNLELYIDIEASSILFEKSNDPKGFVGGTLIEIEIFQKDQLVFSDRARLKSPLLKDTSKLNFVLSAAIKAIIPTEKSTIKLRMYQLVGDQGLNISSSVPIDLTEVRPNNLPMLSDIEMARKADTLKPKDMADDLTKSGLRIQPYPSDFYPATAKKIKCYLEVYDLDKAETDSALLSYKIIKLPTFEVLNEWGMVERIKPMSKSAHYKEIDIEDLPSGHYRLQLALISSKGKILSLKDKSIFRSNPTSDEAQSTTELAPKISTVGTFVDSIKGRNIKQYLYHLGAIASKAESGTINTLVASTDYALMRSFYLEFWNRRNKVQAYEMHTDYRASVKEAYRKYGQKSKPLLESDRARVYLRFGEPNQILTEQTDLSSNSNLVYEIWQYYSLERTGQTGVDFVFVRESSSSQYVLVHSTATGERRNDNWRSSSRIR